MNTLAYIIYLSVTYLITVHVGFVFYKNGRQYLLHLFKGDVVFTNVTNKLLLTGYYLLNLGYAAVMLQFWETIHTWAELFVSICSTTGTILLTLALIHFFNMTVLLLISTSKQFFNQHKK